MPIDPPDPLNPTSNVPTTNESLRKWLRNPIFWLAAVVVIGALVAAFAPPLLSDNTAANTAATSPCSDLPTSEQRQRCYQEEYERNSAGAGAEGTGAFSGVFGVVLLVLLYFLPSLVARKKPNANSVFVLNLFLGWTLIGWVVALAMAVNKPTPRVIQVTQPVAPVASQNAGPTKRCPFCAEEILEAAIVCKHCGRDLPTKHAPELPQY